MGTTVSHKIKIGLICWKINFNMHCSPQIQVYTYIRKILFYFEIFGFLIRNVVLIFFTWSGIRNSDLKETARSQAATEYCIVF